MDIKRIETLTTSELLSEGQVARVIGRRGPVHDFSLWRVSDTPTAEVLRKALALLGPNGERWLNSGAPYCGDAMCAGWAVRTVLGADRASDNWNTHGGHDAVKLLNKAANDLYACGYISLNDKARDFSKVRSMFERAITLAATP